MRSQSYMSRPQPLLLAHVYVSRYSLEQPTVMVVVSTDPGGTGCCPAFAGMVSTLTERFCNATFEES
jgi:hypothetical protein